jgi:hypothetical protein
MSFNSTNTTSIADGTAIDEKCKLFQSTSYIVQLVLGLASFTVLIGR